MSVQSVLALFRESEFTEDPSSDRARCLRQSSTIRIGRASQSDLTSTQFFASSSTGGTLGPSRG